MKFLYWFSKPKVRLSCLTEPFGDSVLIALEDIGHYAYNLVVFLRKLGYTVITYNPLLIKEFVKSFSLRKTKTDVKDALVIAQKLKADIHPERFEVDEAMQKIKELTRYQNCLIQARSKNKNLYVRLLDVIFLEFARIVGNVHNQYVYELLTHYPTPQKINRASFGSLLTIKQLTASKTNEIQDAVQFKIGDPSPAFQLELKQLISII